MPHSHEKPDRKNSYMDPIVELLKILNKTSINELVVGHKLKEEMAHGPS